MSGGFKNKAQMRYLLMVAAEHPEKYSWVWKILDKHGVPESDGPTHEYWEGPYNVSPATPSYTYTGRSAANMKSLLKIAEILDADGKNNSAMILDKIVNRRMK